MVDNYVNEELTDEEIISMTEDQIIERLLEPTEIPKSTIFVDRIGIPVTLKGLSEKEIFKIRRQCTYTKKKRGQKIEKLNEEEFNAALIVAATIKPNWNNPKLLEALKASDGTQIIKKKFLAGETASMADKVLELSGFNDDLEEVKNS